MRTLANSHSGHNCSNRSGPASKFRLGVHFGWAEPLGPHLLAPPHTHTPQNPLLIGKPPHITHIRGKIHRIADPLGLGVTQEFQKPPSSNFFKFQTEAGTSRDCGIIFHLMVFLRVQFYLIILFDRILLDVAIWWSCTITRIIGRVVWWWNLAKRKTLLHMNL